MSVVGAGVPIGLTDRNGRPIHIGDSLEFDKYEWHMSITGMPKGAEAPIFQILIERGEITMLGTPDDLGNWCTIVRGWDEPAPAPQAPVPHPDGVSRTL